MDGIILSALGPYGTTAYLLKIPQEGTRVPLGLGPYFPAGFGIGFGRPGQIGIGYLAGGSLAASFGGGGGFPPGGSGSACLPYTNGSGDGCGCGGDGGIGYSTFGSGGSGGCGGGGGGGNGCGPPGPATCVFGARGNLPNPGGNVNYDPGSANVGACPAVIWPLPP